MSDLLRNFATLPAWLTPEITLAERAAFWNSL